MTEVVASEAPAFSVVADVAIVKGESPARDSAWLSFPDGTARREAVHVIHDLPHLVVESVFGLGDGLWGSRASGRRAGLRLVTDAAFREQAVAKAAVQAVLNRWGDGPDTPAGVRERLRGSGPEPAELAAAHRRADQGGRRRGPQALPRLGGAAGRRHAARHLAAA